MRAQTTNIDTRIYVGGPNYSGGGSDSNDGSLACPLATIAEAVNRVKGDLDLYRDTIVTVELLGSSYNGNVHFPAPLVGGEGGGRLRLLGSPSVPYRPLLTSSIQETVGIYTGACLRLEHLALQCTGGNCVNASLGGQVFLRDILFYDAHDYHVAAADGGRVEFENDCSIAAGGNAKGFIRAGAMGRVVYGGGHNLTLQGGVSFSECFVKCEQGSVDIFPAIIGVSNAMGQRYSVTKNGVITTPNGSQTYLPGTVSGTASAGGVYC